MYYMNENTSGYLPENDPMEFETLAELKAALRERKKELKEYFENPKVDTWESITALRKEHFVYKKNHVERFDLKNVPPHITIFGVCGKDDHSLPIYVFAWIEE
jgi:hypothetical protein